MAVFELCSTFTLFSLLPFNLEDSSSHTRLKTGGFVHPHLSRDGILHMTKRSMSKKMRRYGVIGFMAAITAATK